MSGLTRIQPFTTVPTEESQQSHHSRDSPTGDRSLARPGDRAVNTVVGFHESARSHYIITLALALLVCETVRSASRLAVSGVPADVEFAAWL
jgi:hypothetical protein